MNQKYKLKIGNRVFIKNLVGDKTRGAISSIGKVGIIYKIELTQIYPIFVRFKEKLNYDNDYCQYKEAELKKINKLEAFMESI